MTEFPDDQHPESVRAVWIDRQGGSGSLDATVAWSQAQHSSYQYANDGRSETRTTLYWDGQESESPAQRSRDRHQLHRDPDDRRSWETLAKWNDGVGSPTRKADNRSNDLKRWCQILCSKIDCNNYQYERTHAIVSSLSLESFGSISTEAVILGAISLVVDADTDSDPDNWTPDDWIIYRDTFEQLMDDIGMSRDQLWSVRRRVHAESEYFDDSPSTTGSS